VSVVVFASVTILPALLGFAGHSIDRLRLPWFRHDVNGRRTLSWRWSRIMQRRPLAAALGALAVLLILAAPATGLRFGMPDAGNGPSDLTSRRAYDLVSKGFGPGANGPLLVAVNFTASPAIADPRPAAGTVDRIVGDLRATDGVATVLPPAVNDAGDTAVITVIPTTGPQDAATERLVHTMRDHVLPDAVAGTGAEASVGGITAAFIDDSESTASRLPLIIGGVVALSFLLLMSVFRSLVVALKAAVMNLLSIGAAFGVMALAASGGWLGHLVGIENPTPVPAWLPMMMFAILFGLSMDYEVFLLSRVREEYVRPATTPCRRRRPGQHGPGDHRRGGDHGDGVRRLRAPDAVFLKLAGLGSRPRCSSTPPWFAWCCVPATMELLGDRNWWLPRWLDRLLPHVNVADEPPPIPDPTPTATDSSRADGQPDAVPVP
jgi:RND superfamily putative drug exporter